MSMRIEAASSVVDLEGSPGWPIVVRLDGDEPKPASGLKRIEDSAQWYVRALEWWGVARRPVKGDTVAILLGGVDPAWPPKIGDELERCR